MCENPISVMLKGTKKKAKGKKIDGGIGAQKFFLSDDTRSL